MAAPAKPGSSASRWPGSIEAPNPWRRARGGLGRLACLGLWILIFCGGAGLGRAALQFDVFLGYDGIVPEGSWFPVVCEIKNDGPPFVGTVELDSGNQSQMRRAVVELPTGTLKRFSIPVFSTTRGYSSWDARLVDERGKVRAEQPGLRARRQTAADTTIIGAITRTPGGTPMIKAILPQQAELQPSSARLLPTIFPDNPLVLEGMDAVYLNSEKAPELKLNQIDALMAWLNAGGHLIVAVEQISDVTSTPWLKKLLPVELKDVKALPRHTEIQKWLQTSNGQTNIVYTQNIQYQGSSRNRPAPRPGVAGDNPFSDLLDDYTFETAEMQVVTGTVKEGRTLVAAGDTPLIVAATHGRGRVTALLFSPEREPFRSWKNLPVFWAKLAEIPGELYVSADYNRQGWGAGTDGIFGAMIDSNQVHKLPVEWLLLLLIVYLAVIGPLDQYWLKKIGRPMLTWITFPCYVVLFSLLIYFIGYKLRAGESEWNELHLVDILRNGDHAELRGRTYASVYSPSNQRYLLESQQKYATLRGEFVGSWGGGQSSEKATIMQNGDSFKAEIFVPVWTSQLFISDWWHSASMPLSVTVSPAGAGWQVKVENRTEQKLTEAQIAVDDYIIKLGELPAKETKTFTISKEQGTPLKDFVWKHGQAFQSAVGSRQQAFGGSDNGRVVDLPNSTVAASFISQLARQPNQQNYAGQFVAPHGLDLTPVIDHGGAVLFAWAGDYSPVKAMRQFSPKRTHKDTLWRMPVEIK